MRTTNRASFKTVDDGDMLQKIMADRRVTLERCLKLSSVDYAARLYNHRPIWEPMAWQWRLWEIYVENEYQKLQQRGIRVIYTNYETKFDLRDMTQRLLKDNELVISTIHNKVDHWNLDNREELNLKLRAVHDLVHIDSQLGFTFVEECGVYLKQVAGVKVSNLQEQELLDSVLFSETVLQAASVLLNPTTHTQRLIRTTESQRNLVLSEVK